MSKYYDYIKGLEDLAETPYDIFKGQNPIETILGEGSIINPRKLELYEGITNLDKTIRLVLPEIFENQQPSDLHRIRGEHGETIVTLSKPPFNLKDISNPSVSHSGTWCLTNEDLKYFEGLAHRPISDKKSDIINKDIDADSDFKYKGEIIGDSAVSTDRDVIDSKTL